MELSLAPLQTYTDYHFRNAHQQIYGGVDKFYAPYLRMNNDGTIKQGPKLDVLPENNLVNIIPQLMCCSVEDFFILHDYLVELGYTEVNWNMGCPYPMVTNKGLGAGVLNNPQLLKSWLEAILPKTKLALGIKMRMGMNQTSEIRELIPILNSYPLKEVIIHARNAEQLYNGSCDHIEFNHAFNQIVHRVIYNGDICTLDDLDKIARHTPDCNAIMIGRGAVKNPAIFNELKSGILLGGKEYRTKLIEFSKLIEESCLSSNPNSGYALMRLKSYWEGFTEELSEGKPLFRKLKKTNTLTNFWNTINQLLEL